MNYHQDLQNFEGVIVTILLVTNLSNTNCIY